MTIYEQRTVCPYDCPDTCGMIAVTDGEKILSVRGDPEHPITRGILCRKMQHYEKDIHSPHRIMTPLIRTGRKGSPESFTPISWDEAITKIGSTWRTIIEENGSDAILPYSYAGNMGMIQRNCGEAFFARLGAANLDRTICSAAKGGGASITMGSFCDWNSPQIASCDVILLWSSNPKSNRLHVVPQIQTAKKAGAKVFLIDVYENISADLADDVLLVKPGTDVPLLLALMYELEKNGQLDMDFIRQYTTGFDDLKKEYASCSPEDAEKICGVPAKDIRALARAYGAARRPMIVTGSGMSRYSNGGAAFRLLMCLPALVGAWKRGGGTSSFMGSSAFFSKDCIKHPEWIRPNLRSYNMNRLGQALLSDGHPVRSLYVYVSNPAVMTPDQQNVLRGLERDDLFTVVHDRFLTDTALYADIVLPAAFSVEQDDIYTSYGHYHTQVGWKVIDPPGQCKTNWDTFRLLAKEMGFYDSYWNRPAKEFVESLLDGVDSGAYFRYPASKEDIRTLRRGEAVLVPQADVMRWGTDDGKIHLSPKVPAYSPLKDQSHPLRLVMTHSPWSLNSNFSYREELMKNRGPLTLKMNPEDAKKRGISDRDICTAHNDFGTITAAVRVTDKVPSGTVIAEGVYQKDFTFGDGNFSSLISETLTDLAGAAPLNTQSVEISKKAY